MIWPLGRRKQNALSILSGGEWRCVSCDVDHQGMFDLAAFSPDPWSGPSELEPNSSLTLDRNFLSEDFCVLGGQYFFVRCVLDIPVLGMDRSFGFGCWGTLSRPNFEDYVSRFDAANYAGVGPWTSWLCNDLMGLVGSEPIGCHMFPQLDRQRPVLRVHDDGHRLAVMQLEGISPETVLQIYTHYGHSIA